jgi:starvation-inducible outer membrane lipoprotein
MKQDLNHHLALATCLVLLVLVAGCSTPALFPSDIANNSSSLEFGVLQAKPDVFNGRVVQLAGRIVGVEQADGGTLILAHELPLVKHPAYGPTEASERTSAFAILYPGKVEPNALWYGNKFVVIAVAQGEQTVAVDGIPRKEPYMVAQCMHVWKTGGYYDVSDFPHVFDGYYPLEQQTYCAK